MKRSFPVEVMWCPNGRGRGKNRLGWQFPPKVREQLLKDTEGLSVLHLFGGRADFGTRLDIDLTVRPDVIGDAWLPPFGRDSFDVVVMDPPYVRLSGQARGSLMRTAAWLARKRVVWFSTQWMSAGCGLKMEKAWLIRVGDNCLIRTMQYFSVNEEKHGLPTRFHRGIQMKYNRWLAQPVGLKLFEGETFL